MGDKLLLFHLKNKVPLEGLLGWSGTPPPPPPPPGRRLSNTPKVNKNPSRVLSFSVLMCRPLPLPCSPHRFGGLATDALPVCFLSISLTLSFSPCFGTPAALPSAACRSEGISPLGWVGGGVGVFGRLLLLMGSCLANNKVLELSSASTTP